MCGVLAGNNVNQFGSWIGFDEELIICLMDISEVIQEEDKKELEDYRQTVCRLMKCSEIGYWIGNPSVEITSGEIFLQQMKFPAISQQKPLELLVKRLRELNPSQGRCLVVMGIPNSKSPDQVSEAIGQQLSMAEESRVVKTSDSGFYALLMRFADQTKASQFYNRYFGHPYNSIEKELLLLRPVKGITVSFDEFNIENRKIQLGILRKKSSFDEPSRITPEGIFVSYNLSILGGEGKPNFTCAICFEEMGQIARSSEQLSPTKQQNEVTEKKAIVSILCGHYFHWECLGRWTEKTCPLCRYHQQPPKLSFCQSCNISEGLWLCLICGKKLCSGQLCDLTSQQSHIYSHYKEEAHTLAMDIQTKFVYDFHSKDFIHRVYNDDSGRPQGQTKKDKKDTSQLVKEYNFMMKEQMEQQRNYFEKEQYKIRTKQLRTLNELAILRDQVASQVSSLQETCEGHFATEEQEIRQLQIQLSTAQKYHKMLVQRSKIVRKQQQEKQQKQSALQEQLNNNIIGMRQQVKDIQRNLDFNKKMKSKMKGQKIASEFFFNTKK